MTVRQRHLADGVVQSSDANTYSLPLPESGFLHALLITVSCTNGATDAHSVSALDVADNVRVMVNGDERAFDLTPVEIEKYHETWQGYPLRMVQDETAGAVQSVVLPVLFGRWLEDTEYFLPCSRVKAPRLEIVYSPTIAAAAGFATGTVTFDVVALWSPENDKLNYRGTITTRTIKTFTSAASGDDTTPIDTTELLRSIGIYAYEAAIEDGVDITVARLVANAGEFDLVSADWLGLLDVTRQRHWSEITHTAKVFWQDDDTFATRLSKIVNVQLHNFFTDSQANDNFYSRQIDAVNGDTLTLNASIGDITAGAETYVTDNVDRPNFVAVKGYCPSYFGLMEWTAMDGESGYLNPADFSSLDLVLSQGGAGAAVRISTQTVHRY